MSETNQSFGFPLTIGTLSDVGCIRTNNEDSVGHVWLEDSSLFVIVADGMGGHEAGEVASSLAVRVVEEVVAREVDGDPRERIYNALLEANEAILDEGGRSGTRGMGTTAIVSILKGDQVYVGLIGDSRCYHFRHGHMIWRTSDHTRVQMLLDQGKITDEEARSHPEAGMLTRALGHARMADGRPLVPDVLDRAVVLEANDTLILSSDGLHDLVDDWEIGRAIAGKSCDEAAEALVALACDRGGHDNVTVAVINAGQLCAAFDESYVPDSFDSRLMRASIEEEENITFDEPQDPTVETVYSDPLDATDEYSQGSATPPPQPVLANTGVVGRRPSAPAPGVSKPAEEKSNKGLIIAGVVAILLIVGLILIVGIGAAVFFLM